MKALTLNDCNGKSDQRRFECFCVCIYLCQREYDDDALMKALKLNDCNGKSDQRRFECFCVCIYALMRSPIAP